MTSPATRVRELNTEIESLERQIARHKGEIHRLSRVSKPEIIAETGLKMRVGLFRNDRFEVYSYKYTAEELRGLQDLLPDIIEYLEES